MRDHRELIAVAAAWIMVGPMVAYAVRRTRTTATIGVRNLGTLALMVLLSAGAVSFGRSLLHTALGIPSPVGVAALLLWDLDRNVLFAAMVAALTIARDELRLMRQCEREIARMADEHALVRLRALEAQLHPHFLFNSLHSIAALLKVRPLDAQLMISQLTQLLERTLAPDERVRVPLAEEMQFVHSYLAIQRLRFSGSIDCRITFAPALGEALVPRLLLQPLVENALQHGLSGSERIGTIEVCASQEHQHLVVEIRDNGRGFRAPKNDNFEFAKGVGLSNTQRRLAELYGNDASVSVRAGGESGCIVQLRLPLSFAQDEVLRSAPRMIHTSHAPALPSAREALRPAAWTFLATALFWFVLTLANNAKFDLEYPAATLAGMAVAQSAILVCLVATVALASQRFPIVTPHRARSVLAHVVIVVIVPLAHLATDWLLRQTITLPSIHAGELWAFDLAAAVSASALAQWSLFARRARVDRLKSAILQRENAEAMLTLRRIRLDPELIRGWLTAVVDRSTNSYANALSLVVAIGDYLRLVIRASSHAHIRIDDDFAILSAYRRVCDYVANRSGRRLLSFTSEGVGDRLVPSMLISGIATAADENEPIDFSITSASNSVALSISMPNAEPAVVIAFTDRLRSLVPETWFSRATALADRTIIINVPCLKTVSASS